MCSAAKTKNTIDETANIPPKLDGVYYMIQVRKSSDTNGTNVKLLRFSFACRQWALKALFVHIPCELFQN